MAAAAVLVKGRLTPGQGGPPVAVGRRLLDLLREDAATRRPLPGLSEPAPPAQSGSWAAGAGGVPSAPDAAGLCGGAGRIAHGPGPPVAGRPGAPPEARPTASRPGARRQPGAHLNSTASRGPTRPGTTQTFQPHPAPQAVRTGERPELTPAKRPALEGTPRAPTSFGRLVTLPALLLPVLAPADADCTVGSVEPSTPPAALSSEPRGGTGTFWPEIHTTSPQPSLDRNSQHTRSGFGNPGPSVATPPRTALQQSLKEPH